MEVTFLGTGAGLPSKDRNVTAIVLNLLAEQNELWLFDCGEATQHQLLHTSLKPRKINKIFITHLHGDHIFGLVGFLSSRSFQGGTDSVTIYGPTGLQEIIETTLTLSKTKLTYPINYKALQDGNTVCENSHFSVECLELDHGIQSFGFRIKEKDKPGILQVDKLKELGIRPGPIYQHIKENDVTVLENGTELRREDFLGKPKQGKQIIIFGDTRYRASHAEFAKDADLIIHEATFSGEMDNLAYQYHHSTTTQAAKLAQEANAKALIMTHISSRYQDKEAEMLLKEAQAIFPPTHIARDFYSYEI